MTVELKTIHKALINFTKRAEKNTTNILVDTFVDSAPLFDLPSTRNNQIMYGQRGTGKTHAPKYLQETVTQDDRQYAVFIDLRTVGSDGALYHDTSKTPSERSVRLVVDVLRLLADELYTIALTLIDSAPHPDQITARIDDLFSAITDVKIVGNIEVETIDSEESQSNTKAGGSVKIAPSAAGIEASGSNARSQTDREQLLERRSGPERIHLEFGRVQGALAGLMAVLNKPTVWLLIDEWGELPLELQPYLADLLRKTVLPNDRIIVKIASIEHRSQFSTAKPGGGYLGLELGADVSADLSLDDFLVFDNNQAKSLEFFKNLIYKHYCAIIGEERVELSSDDLISALFTQAPVFEEFVRAVEGVPRDALNLAAMIATKSYGSTASMNIVRASARDWYQQDKATLLKGNVKLEKILNHIIDKVIDQRKARAFLFPVEDRNEQLDQLFDARILHLLKKNISSHDLP